ncbi:MAG: hypothetical protein DWI57_16700, partial [Chloroflexi bacterium]
MSQSPVPYPAQTAFPAEGKSDASSEAGNELLAAEEQPVSPTDWRMNALRIGALLAITLGSCWLALNPEWVRSFGRWGYLSAFAISLLSSATVI